MHGCKRRPWRASASTRTFTNLRTRSWVCIGRGPIIAPIRQWWQDWDNGQFVCLSYFLMNTGEFTERREAVKGIDKLPILYIFSWQVSITRERDREHCHPPRHEIFRSFSKLVERREAVKLYLTHKLARFFCCRVSNTCVCLHKRVHSKWVPGTRGCWKLTREQALHYTRVTRTRLSSYLWSVLYM